MPISIALVFNLSQQAEAVQQVVEGIELASSDLEKSGLKIKLLKYDSKDSPGGTLKATQQALAEKPDALIAELDSSKAFVAANEAEAAKTVMITPLATSYNITEGKRFVFRGTFSDTQQGDALAKFAIKNGSKTVAIVSDVGQLYSQTLAKRFASAFLTNGGKVILAEEINPDDQAFEKAFQKISALKPDVVFCPIYSQAAARFLYLSRQKGLLDPIYIGGDAWGQYTQPFRDLLFKERAKLKVFWAAHYNEGSNYKPLVDFIERYEKSSKKKFNVAPAVSYDVTMVLARAIVKAGGHGAAQQKIASALRGSLPYKGLTGDFSFNDSNDNRKSVFIVTAKAGKPQVVTEVAP